MRVLTAALLALHSGYVCAFVCPSSLHCAQFSPAPVVAGAVPSASRALSSPLKAIASEGDVNARRAFLQSAIAAGCAVRVAPAANADASSTQNMDKAVGISDEELRKKLEYDVVKNQFMVTGVLTRSLYDESCTFTDEIDTYTLDKWIQGTGLLFKNDYSKMELDGPITITDKEATFRFKEKLMFNIPILKPKVPLTGSLVLKRGKDGLFTSYKESWDQSVSQVLLSATLF